MTTIRRRRLSGFIEPCQPSKVARPPSGPLWVHEIKHDGYRLMVLLSRRDKEKAAAPKLVQRRLILELTLTYTCRSDDCSLERFRP
jgi:hypothetical protein